MLKYGINEVMLNKESDMSISALTKLVENLRVSGSAGGGDVIVTMDAAARMTNIQISGQMMDLHTKELLEKLILSAHQQAHDRLQEELMQRLEWNEQ